MAKTLVIAEKYLAACDMANVLNCKDKKEGYIEGENYIVTWADGHLVGFQYPEEYNPEYKQWKLSDIPLQFDADHNLKILEGKEKQFNVIKRLIQGTETDLIINAGDAGREGYLLQYWIYKMAENKKPVKVLWASSMTENALVDAFENLHDESEFSNVLEEAITRAELDDILGMNYSRLLTLKCSNDGVTLPYGRCMTTLLNLIIMQEKAINEFVPEKKYGIEVIYEDGFKGTLVDADEKALDFESKIDAEAIVQEMSNEGAVMSAKMKDTREKAPLLYNLPDLQGAIGRKYKYSPAKTLEIMQALYSRHKIITYPRTDATYLTTDLKQTIDKNLECCRFGKFKAALERCEKVSPPDADYFNDEKVTDHHTIIPNDNENIRNIYKTLSDEEKNVFDEIVFSFLGLFCRERITKSMSVMINIEGYMFRSNDNAELDAGYKLLRKIEEPEPEMKEFFERIESAESLKEGQKIKVLEIKIKEKQSSPPARFTYGTITLLMQKHNIGTAATMAATVEKLMDKKNPLLAVNNGKYYSTPFGRMYMSVIPDALKDPEMTNQIEWKLSQIRKGELHRKDVIGDIYNELQENINRNDFVKKSFNRCKAVRKPSRSNYKKRRSFDC